MITSKTNARHCLQLYLQWLAETNYSVTTIEVRERTLLAFIKWAEERDVTDFQEVDLALLERYRKHLFRLQSKVTGKALHMGTQRAHLSALRQLLHWAKKKQILPTNAALELDLPKVGRSLPKAVLTAPEAEQVLRSIDLDMPAGVRDRAILETFYSTGIRRRELANLRLEDVEFGRGTVTVRQGKGAKDRMLPIGERALEWIRKYLTEVRPYLVRGDDPGLVFLTRSGKPLNISSLSRSVYGHVSRGEMGKTGSCHLFRHTMATVMLDGGADVRHVQEMLGHEHLQSTQVYTHVAIHKLKAVHAATHPGANLQPRQTEPEELVDADPKADKPK